MKTGISKFILASTLLAILAPLCPAQTLTTLHTFSGMSSSGIIPYGTPLVAGNVIYGVSASSGANGNGTIFRVNTDGTGYTNIYNFTGGTDGAHPAGGLILSNGVLYGNAFAGGANGAGTVFEVNTDGTGFVTLHSFSYITEGANPESPLLLLGNTLYGTTFNGGNNNHGGIFKVNTDGTGFAAMHLFSTDGLNPLGALVNSNNVLFGTAWQGGFESGTIFAINTDGTGFRTVHNFAYPDAGPNGLIYDNGVLYGVLNSSVHNGKVFKMNPDNTGYFTLHDFTNGPDGEYPFGTLALSNNVLYGAVNQGSTNGTGAVFAINTDGTGFTTLASFARNGGSAWVGMALCGNTLYGTENDSTNPADGVVFKLNTDGSDYGTFAPLTTSGSDGAYPQAGLFLCSNVLYGTTVYGGTNNDGTVFQINSDGSGFATVHSFADNGDGANPYSQLISSGNFLYGTTADYNNSAGSVFRISLADGSFTTLYDFGVMGGPDMPMAGLALSNTNLFGTTQMGGGNYNGTIFEVDTNGAVFNTLYTFSPAGYNELGNLTNSDGANPQSQFVLSGNVLYGTAFHGGWGGNGTLFSLKTDGTGFTTLHTFDEGSYNYNIGLLTNNDGANPACGMTLWGNTLYGTTSAGGLFGGGTVFKMNPDGTGFVLLHVFGNTNTANDGTAPFGTLLISGNVIYGTAANGGSQYSGTIFQMNTDGTGYRTLYSCTSGNGGTAIQAGLILSSNVLFGTATYGGGANAGTLFSLFVPPQLCLSASGSNITLIWPTNALGFTLQSTANLSPADWAPVSPGPTVVNGQNTVTTSITNVSQFYRLTR